LLPVDYILQLYNPPLVILLELCCAAGGFLLKGLLARNEVLLHLHLPISHGLEFRLQLGRLRSGCRLEALSFLLSFCKSCRVL
jgi:hypothetical protein